MRRYLSLAMVALAVVLSVLAYPRLPQTVATHWGADGAPNGWSGRLTAVSIMPAVMLALWLLFQLLPRIDPRRENYAKFRSTYDAIVWTALLFMLILHAATLASGLGYPVPMDRLVLFGVGAMFIVIGNLLPRARPNWFVGVRTPWTLSSDTVWTRTHRVAGVVFLLMGALMIAAGAFVRGRGLVWLMLLLVPMSLGIVVYSYVLWRREQHP